MENANQDCIDVLCRGCLCASTDFQPMDSILENSDDENIDVVRCETTFVNMFEECTSLKVTKNDGLPDVLCSLCVEELTASYNFRHKCRNTDQELRNIVLTDELVQQTDDDDDDDGREHQFEVEKLNEAIEIVGNTQEDEQVLALYPCRKCFKYFVKYHDVDQHLQNVHQNEEDEELYKCPVCDIYGFEYDDFIQHVNEIHTEQQLVQCGYCDMKFTDEKLIGLHFTNVHRIEFVTDVEEFTLENTLEEIDEISQHSGGDDDDVEKKPMNVLHKPTESKQVQNEIKEESFRCHFEDCTNIELKSEEDLIEHNSTYHKSTGNVCVLCKKEYPSLRSLRSHMRTHSTVKKYKCSQCEKAFNFHHHLKNHEATHNPFAGNEVCAQCGKIFKTKDRLQLHERIHKNERRFKCEQCGKAFISNSSLKIHYASHSNDKPFVCAKCGNAFKLLAFLNAHIKKHDSSSNADDTRDVVKVTDLKRNVPTAVVKSSKTPKMISDKVCRICEIEFNTPAELRQHLRTHSYKFSCTLCSKSFALLHKLESHMRTHEAIKKHRCSTCHASFHRSDVLRHHILKMHNAGERPYKCDMCNKSFFQSCDLKVHKRRHLGERPFTCEICDKSYATTTALYTHKRSHTGEKPYVCNICHKGFTSMNGLSHHSHSHNKSSSAANNDVDNLIEVLYATGESEDDHHKPNV